MLWAEVAQAVVYVHNRTVLRNGTKEVPEALWRIHPTDKPSVEGLRVLLCDAWVLVPAEKREGALASKADLGIFVGYDEARHCYRVFDVVTHMVTVTRDVKFDQSKFTQCAALVAQQGGHGTIRSFGENLERLTFDNEVRFVEMISLREHQASEKAKEDAGAMDVAPSPEPKEDQLPAAVVVLEPEQQIPVAPSRPKGVRFVFNGMPVAQVEAAAVIQLTSPACTTWSEPRLSLCCNTPSNR